MVREVISLECSSCKQKNYMTNKETRGTPKLEIKKYCKHERKHTVHVEKKKK
ncbi:MAG: 50S ribosomal protein L33 [Planctomycetota bacterium]|jgi:large subunit ribosomal protein L33